MSQSAFAPDPDEPRRSRQWEIFRQALRERPQLDWRVPLDGPLIWLGGARDAALRYTPSERGLYRALGLAVGLVAVFGGCGAALAAGAVFHRPALHYWPLGLLWAITICNIDRMLLFLATGGRQFLVWLLPRIAITLLLGFLVGEPLALRILNPEITEQMTQTSQVSQQAQLKAARQHYQPLINADNLKIKTLDGRLQKLRTRVDNDAFKGDCEHRETDCSTSHLLGEGPRYHQDRRLEASAKANLRREKPQIQGQIDAAHKDLTQQQQLWQSADQKIIASIGDSDGLIAREKALGQLEASSARVRDTVWFIRGGFMLVDLIPMLAVTAITLLGLSIYHKINQAMRLYEQTVADEYTEAARVRRNGIRRRGAAANATDEAQVEFDEDAEINDLHGHGGSSSGSQWRGAGSEVGGVSLVDFTRNNPSQESLPIEFANGLRRLALLSFLLQTIATVLGWLLRHAGHGITGFWGVVTVLAGSAVLALISRGFRRGSIRLHRSVFVDALVGLVTVTLLFVVNL